MLSYQIILL